MFTPTSESDTITIFAAADVTTTTTHSLRSPQVDPDTTYVDEIFGWSLAALGFYIQFKMGFSPPWFFQVTDT